METKKHSTLLEKFVAQFKDLMIIILMIAALISMLAGEVSDSIIIFIVVFLNAVFGVFQETKAENAIDSLKEMTTPFSRVKIRSSFPRVWSLNSKSAWDGMLS